MMGPLGSAVMRSGSNGVGGVMVVGMCFVLQTKWMMYWIVFALFQALEMVTDIFLPW